MRLKVRHGQAGMLVWSMIFVGCGSHAPPMSGEPSDEPDQVQSGPCDIPGTICTVAGTGMSLFDGDGRAARETSFYYPLDIEFDLEGRALILDWNNLRVRRINEDGTIETIMGIGLEAFPENGALAVDTPLHHPSDIEMTPDGVLYVAGNHVPVVFLVETDNRVSVIAGSKEYGYGGDGGPATEAVMSVPFGALPDDRGGFYVTDYEAHVIRYVDVNGAISTAAGTGERGYAGDGGPAVDAMLNGPTRLAMGPDGLLYFCDTNNNVVRRIEDDETISNVAGIGERGYSGDGGPAEEAALVMPYDLKFAPNGDLYIADTGNNVIRRIDAEGMISTVVGTGVEGYAGDEGPGIDCEMDGPSGIKFDVRGSMWIADTFNQRVRRVADFLSIVDQQDIESLLD
jgi:hypothetical protein